MSLTQSDMLHTESLSEAASQDENKSSSQHTVGTTRLKHVDLPDSSAKTKREKPAPAYVTTVRRKINKPAMRYGFSPQPLRSNEQPGSQRPVQRDAERPRAQQLIRTQHSGSSKNASAILSFKNTGSHRFRHNCQRSSREEGREKKKKTS